MSLTPGLGSAIDLFHKLQRDIGRLDNEVTSDKFFDFVITGYSLIDWVKNDPALPATARAHAEIQKLYAEPWLKVCGDLANASKHFKLTTREPVTSSASSTSGYGSRRFGKGNYGHDEETIVVEISNGSVWTALEFAVGVLQAWIQFFARHSIRVDKAE